MDNEDSLRKDNVDRIVRDFADFYIQRQVDLIGYEPSTITVEQMAKTHWVNDMVRRVMDSVDEYLEEDQ